MKVRQFSNNDLQKINSIVKMLHPKWFDNNALKNIPIDVQVQRCLVAMEDDELLGFCSFFTENGEAKIGWIGVSLDHHHQGVGKKLLNRAELELKELGVKVIRVETVVELDPKDGSYDLTMKFYSGCGFEIEKRLKEERDKGYVFRKGVLKKVLE